MHQHLYVYPYTMYQYTGLSTFSKRSPGLANKGLKHFIGLDCLHVATLAVIIYIVLTMCIFEFRFLFVLL